MASFTEVLLGIAVFGVAISMAEEPVRPDPQPLREFHGTTTDEVVGPIPEELIQDQVT